MTVISDIYSLQVSGNAAAALAELDKRLAAVTEVFEEQTDKLDKYRGQVDAVSDRLKLLGEAGVQAANAIEEIGDPIERVRLASQLFNEQLTATPTVFDKVNNRLLEYKARLALVPGPLKAVAAGQLALAAIAGGVLIKSIQAAAKADAELARQLESLERSSNTALASISKFAIGEGGLRGLALASNSAGSSLDKLAEYFDALEDSGTAGFIAVNNIKTAMTAVLTGPLFPLITGVRLLNQAFGEGEDAARKFNAEVVAQLRLEAAQELNAERRKKVEDAIKLAERRRLEGVKFRAEEYRTTGVVVRGQELSADAARLYTDAQEEQNKKIRENLALKEELIPLIGKEEALRLGLIEAEKEEVKQGTKERLPYYADLLSYNLKLIEAEKERMALLQEQIDAEKQQTEEATAAIFERINARRQEREEATGAAALEASKLALEASATAAEESEQRWSSALTSIRDSAIETGFAIADLAISTAIAGGGFDAFAQGALASLGTFASNAGKVLFLTGLGLEAIGKVFPGGAIVAGLGLMATGAIIGGLAQSAFSGGGAQDASARVIGDVRSAADRRARDDDRRDRELPPIILKIGAREFGEAIMDTQRRGYA